MSKVPNKSPKLQKKNQSDGIEALNNSVYVNYMSRLTQNNPNMLKLIFPDSKQEDKIKQSICQSYYKL